MILTGGTQNVEIDIFGADLNTLSRLANQVIGRVRGIPGLQNVDINWQEAMPEIDWQVDRRKANQLGVSFSDVANTIDTATNGTIASYYQESGFEYPIIVQLPVPIRKTVPQMQRLIVNHTSTVITSAVTPNITGSSATGMGGASNAPPQVNPTPITQQDIELRQLAQPLYTMGPSEITRLNRQRYVAVLGTPVGRSAGQVQDGHGQSHGRNALSRRILLGLGTDSKANSTGVQRLGPVRFSGNRTDLHAAGVAI